MFALYVICAVVGVGLALIAAIMGDHSHGGDAHVEFGHVGSSDAGHEVDHDAQHSLWLPFLSLRFWTYAMGGFGLTGVLVSLFAPVAPHVILALALGMGLGCGLLVAILMKVAMKGQAELSTGTRELLGHEAEVLVAIRPNAVGKVRLSLRGETIDMLAIADDDIPIEAGTSAVVVSVDGDKARVVSRDSIFDDSTLTRA